MLIYLTSSFILWVGKKKRLTKYDEKKIVWIIIMFSYENSFVVLLHGLLLLHPYFIGEGEVPLYKSESLKFTKGGTKNLCFFFNGTSSSVWLIWTINGKMFIFLVVYISRKHNITAISRVTKFLNALFHSFYHRFLNECL